jgi:ATP-dependent RNA helicase DDX55/SPB4
MKAFVSFIRAYSKHEASFIFRLKNLDFVGIAESYGLLRLPRMPELKSIDTSHWRDADIEVRYVMFGTKAKSPAMLTVSQWNSYSYADKAQEAKRLTSAAAIKESSDSKRSSSKSSKDHIPWSKQLSKKDTKEKRRVQKTRKKAWKASTQLEEGHKEHTTLKRTRFGSEEKYVDPTEAEDDWASLAEEERLAKKLKKGKISQAEFDATTFVDM